MGRPARCTHNDQQLKACFGAWSLLRAAHLRGSRAHRIVCRLQNSSTPHATTIEPELAHVSPPVRVSVMASESADNDQIWHANVHRTSHAPAPKGSTEARGGRSRV